MRKIKASDNLDGSSEKDRSQTIRKARWGLVATLIIPVLLVAGLFILLLSIRNSAETSLANLAALLPVGYAFGAGMVASVNPCGFFLLPSYLSFFLGAGEADFYQFPLPTRIFKALLMGSAATAGFVVIFAIAGVLISAGGQWLIEIFPFAGVFIGSAMIFLGFWLLITRRSLGITVASRVTVSQERNIRNVFLFGIAYATGSLSCTLPIFLVVVGSSLSSDGLAASFCQFISYALGMGSIMIAVTFGSAVFQDSVVKLLRRAIPYVYRMSAMFLVAAGAYLVYYWVFFVGLSF
jgi:cytochrome c biogenesis protein CcdA